MIDCTSVGGIICLPCFFNDLYEAYSISCEQPDNRFWQKLMILLYNSWYVFREHVATRAMLREAFAVADAV
jgi:hypothetical protein